MPPDGDEADVEPTIAPATIKFGPGSFSISPTVSFDELDLNKVSEVRYFTLVLFEFIVSKILAIILLCLAREFSCQRSNECRL